MGCFESHLLLLPDLGLNFQISGTTTSGSGKHAGVTHEAETRS
jgi:hypothetical protein